MGGLTRLSLSARTQPLGKFVAHLLAVTAVIITLNRPAYCVTKYVCPSGCQYSSINTAVASELGPGVTIEVAAGVYREQVNIAYANRGTQASPAIIHGTGAVILDGSDPYDTQGQWTQHSGNVYYATATTSNFSTTKSKVIVDGVWCTYVSGSDYANLGTNQFGYDSGAQRVYLNVGGGNPGAKATHVGNKNRNLGINLGDPDVDGAPSFVTIDGITTIRHNDTGIDIRGDDQGGAGHGDIREITVKNCTVSYSRGNGIYFGFANAAVLDHNTSHHNGGNGILFASGDSSEILFNHAYNNDDPLAARGGKAGIKVNDTTDSTAILLSTIDYNVVHDNEDSGIDIHGSKHVTVRRNLSYFNHDHGFDHNHARYLVLLNNVAWRNDHDGVSIENTCRYTSVYSNILARNGVSPSTLGTNGNEWGPVRELYVPDTTGFRSDYNLFYGLKQGSGGMTSPGDRILVHLSNGSGQRYYTLADYTGPTTGLDDHSHSSAPSFTDTLNALFTVASNTSEAVDRGATVYQEWWAPSSLFLSADPNGLVPHDVDGQSGGAGSPAYVDRGVYEYDLAPGVASITVAYGKTSIGVSWTAVGDDGASLGTVDGWDIYRNGSIVLTENDAPMAPGGLECHVFTGLSSCTSYNFEVRMREQDNGQTSMSNYVTGSTDCSGNQNIECFDGLLAGGGDEEENMSSALEAVYPLAFEQAYPNPSPGLSRVKWSFSRAETGKPYEIALFDVAGRRVVTVAEGVAKPGLFTEQLNFVSGGARLRNGMYFIRMKIGDQAIRRMVVLAQ